MAATLHSYCRICQAHCGILVDVDDDRVVKVTGDPDHPVSRGYTCSKGRSLPAMHHAVDRLDHPLVGGDVVSWDDLLDDLAQRVGAIVAEHGPDSVACYRSTGWILDTNARIAVDRWQRAIGTRQLYSPATIDTPNRQVVPDLVTGAPFIQPVTDWDHTRLFIACGHNPVVSHGHATAIPDPIRRLRRIQQRGGAVVVIDPRITETARLADAHLQIRPGTDAAVVSFLVRHRLRTGVDHAYLEACADLASVERLRVAVARFDRETTADSCGVDVEELDRVTDLLDGVDRLSWASGTGVSMGSTGNATEWLGWALAAVSGSLDRQGGMLFNPGVIRPQSEAGPMTLPRVTGPPPASRPEFDHAYGEFPSAVLCDEILAGNVRALFSFGGNIAASFPDTGKTREALEALDVFVVAELRHTDSTEMATHVIPCADQLERHDVTFFMDQAFPIPFAQYTRPVVGPTGNRRPLWRVMADLAGRMGLAAAALDDVDGDEDLLRRVIKRARVTLDELQAAPSGVAPEGLPRWDWLIPHKIPNGRLDLAPEALVAELARWWESTEATDEAGLRLVCRRLPHQMNSDLQTIDAQIRAPHPTLLVNEADAAARGLDDGSVVTVTTRAGSTTATVEVTARVRSGVVSLPHSWASPDVNALTSTDDLDPITGMPRLTSLPVSVTAAPGS